MTDKPFNPALGTPVHIKGRQFDPPYVVVGVEGDMRFLARDLATSGPWHFSQLVPAEASE